MSDDIYISCGVAYHLFRANWVTRLPAAMIIIMYNKQFLVCHGKYCVRQAGPCLPWGRMLVLRHGLACNCIIHFRSGSTYTQKASGMGCAMWDILPKRILSPIPEKCYLPISYLSVNQLLFALVFRERQSHCRTLCIISRELSNRTRCNRRTRFREVRV